MTVASFSLATADRAEGRRRATGRTRPSGTISSAFQRTAEIVRDYVKKGTQLFIEGKIQTRSWDDKDSRPEEVQDRDPLSTSSPCSAASPAAKAPLRGGYSKSNTASYDQRSPASAARLRRPGHHRRRHPLLDDSFQSKSKGSAGPKRFSRLLFQRVAEFFGTIRHPPRQVVSIS